MRSTKRSLGLLIASGTVLLANGVSLPGGLRVGAVAQTVARDRESAQAKIALAMSAGLRQPTRAIGPDDHLAV